MTMRVVRAQELVEVSLGVVELRGVRVEASSSELRSWSDAESARIAAAVNQGSEDPAAEVLRQQVRQMLRYGKFKASGRSKPAQEYLLRCATQDGALPTINAPVDILNTVSLASGLPISLLSIKKCSDQLLVRRGRTGESYVFNSVGQEIDVEDLVVTCDISNEQDRPVGSPVKDSMAGKIEATDDHLVAILYAPTAALAQNPTLLTAADNRLAQSFERYIPGTIARVVE